MTVGRTVSSRTTAAHGARSRLRVGPLGRADLPELRQLVDVNPYVNAVLAARLDAADGEPSRLGGELFGARRDGTLTAACFHGGNLVTVGDDPQAWPALAAAVGARPRLSSAVVGRTAPVQALWAGLRSCWPPPRAVRAAQPLLVSFGTAQAADPGVRPVRRAECDRYLSAAAAMFTEELGVSPHVSPGTAAFGLRMAQLIDSGRAFAAFDFRGQVTFKADIGAVTARTCQIQGVWVRPDLRGRGLGTAGLATVFGYALRLAPSVSLYVNDFNAAALRMYRKLGMRQHATLTTVLL